MQIISAKHKYRGWLKVSHPQPIAELKNLGFIAITIIDPTNQRITFKKLS